MLKSKIAKKLKSFYDIQKLNYWYYIVILETI